MCARWYIYHRFPRSTRWAICDFMECCSLNFCRPIKRTYYNSAPTKGAPPFAFEGVRRFLLVEKRGIEPRSNKTSSHVHPQACPIFKSVELAIGDSLNWFSSWQFRQGLHELSHSSHAYLRVRFRPVQEYTEQNSWIERRNLSCESHGLRCCSLHLPEGTEENIAKTHDLADVVVGVCVCPGLSKKSETSPCLQRCLSVSLSKPFLPRIKNEGSGPLNRRLPHCCGGAFS